MLMKPKIPLRLLFVYWAPLASSERWEKLSSCTAFRNSLKSCMGSRTLFCFTWPILWTADLNTEVSSLLKASKSSSERWGFFSEQQGHSGWNSSAHKKDSWEKKFAKSDSKQKLVAVAMVPRAELGRTQRHTETPSEPVAGILCLHFLSPALTPF